LLAKPNGTLIYTNSEFKYIPSVKEWIIKLTNQEWNAKFKEQLDSALDNWMRISVLKDLSSWETYYYNPYRDEVDEYWDNKDRDTLWHVELGKDDIVNYKIKDWDIVIRWRDDWTDKVSTVAIDLKDFLDRSSLSEYVR
jgi:hypothetical protein